MNTINANHKNAIAYALLAFYFLSQAVTDMALHFQSVKWLGSLAALVATVWRMVRYWNQAQTETKAAMEALAAQQTLPVFVPDPVADEKAPPQP